MSTTTPRTLLGTAFAAVILMARVALAADPVCGDVNNDSSVKASDAQQVLRKAVAQPVTLDCSAYDDRFSGCQSELAAFTEQNSEICGQIPGAAIALAVCNASLDACKSNRSSCLETLSSSNADLVSCQGGIATCNDELETCQSDLSTTDADLAYCEASPLGRIHQTGQTLCYAGYRGFPYPCGTSGLYPQGQDGDFQAGISNRFTDNGDTVTDNRTGLIWEKMDNNNAGGIHDKDNAYAWDNMVLGKIIPLNSASFAGYSDWRVPNRNELMSLMNIGATQPMTFSEFNSACVPGCVVATCSCTNNSSYLTSTSHQMQPLSTWGVSFQTGATFASFKTNASGAVRAVRGGS